MFESLNNFIRRLLGWPSGRSVSDKDTVRARIFRDLFGPCRACGGGLDGHTHWRLACAIVGSQQDHELAALVSERRWGDAAKVAQLQHDSDNREYHALRCPVTDRMVLLNVVFTYELSSSSFTEASELLPEADAAAIATLAQDRWLPL